MFPDLNWLATLVVHINMVSVDVSEYAKEHFEKSVRKTLSIPEWLNNAAQEKKINFSKTLQEALIEKIRT